MDSVRRARYREGYKREVLPEPGEVVPIAFDLGWTSQIFNRGHRIRITVAGAGAPYYEPNPNTGEPLTIGLPASTVVARNRIHDGRRFASRIVAFVRPVGRDGAE